MANRMKASLVNDALNMAIARRKPSKGLISHSDRGSQYAPITIEHYSKPMALTEHVT